MRGLVLLLVLGGCAPTTTTAPSARPSSVVASGTPVFRSASGATCVATVGCYEHCAKEGLACLAACDSQATPDAHHAAITLFNCIVRSGCNAEPCARIECNDELQMCGFAIDLATDSLRDTP